MVYRAAVIGLGFIGAGDQVSGHAIGQNVANLDGTHAYALAEHPQVELVTGSSRDEGRRKRFEKRMKVDRTYADWREMLASEKLDIVGVATNSPYHAEITIACAEAGVKAILCEKPIATRLSDADRAIAACRERGALLAINHTRRWHPLWQSIRDELGNGAIGEVNHAVVHWSGGRLGNVGTHFFDALRMILGVEAEAVSGRVDTEVAPDCRGEEFRDPGGYGIVAFSGGIKVFVDAPCGASVPLVIRVVGSLGQITVRGNSAEVELWSGEKRILQTLENRRTSLHAAVDDVVNCLQNGGRLRSTGEDGLATLEVIMGFHVSDRLHGQWVELPVLGTDRKLEVRIG